MCYDISYELTLPTLSISCEFFDSSLSKTFWACALSCAPMPEPSTVGRNWRKGFRNQPFFLKQVEICGVNWTYKRHHTFRYFPLCFSGFSPTSFLSNLPPLAVEVAASPAALPRSSLLIFWGGACVPVMGKALAANWTWLRKKDHTRETMMSYRDRSQHVFLLNETTLLLMSSTTNIENKFL